MMRGLTCNQPYCTLCAIGAKANETRSWRTTYRGAIALHSSASTPGWCRELQRVEPFRSALRGREQPTGVVMAVAELIDCVRCGPLEHETIVGPEWHFGDFSEGRYRFVLANVRPLGKPLPMKGRLGLWSIAPEIEVRIRTAAGL